MSSTQTILCIIAGFLIGWYIFYYVIGDIVRRRRASKQDDYEIKLKVVNTLPTPSVETMEVMYIALDDGEKAKIWLTIYNGEKDAFSWIAISDVEFDKDVSDVLF